MIKIIDSMIQGVGIGMGLNFVQTMFKSKRQQEEDKLMIIHREDFLKYYYNDLIQGQAP